MIKEGIPLWTVCPPNWPSMMRRTKDIRKKINLPDCAGIWSTGEAYDPAHIKSRYVPGHVTKQRGAKDKQEGRIYLIRQGRNCKNIECPQFPPDEANEDIRPLFPSLPAVALTLAFLFDFAIFSMEIMALLQGLELS